jgi:hypothetical protein
MRTSVLRGTGGGLSSEKPTAAVVYLDNFTLE